MKLEPDALRWDCPDAWLTAASTKDIEPSQAIEGQPDAVESLTFGLANRAPSQHVYVRGMNGVGRMALLTDLARAACAECGPALDKCFVHNFTTPDQPQLIQVPRGKGASLKDLMERFVRFVREEAAQLIESERLESRKSAIESKTQREMRELSAPFDAQLSDMGLTLVPIQNQGGVVPTILPLTNGKPMSPDEFREKRASGEITPEAAEALIDKINSAEGQLKELSKGMSELQEKHADALRELITSEVRDTAHRRLEAIANVFAQPEIATYLKAVEDDLVEHRLGDLENPAFTRLYEVNVLSSHAPDAAAPIIVERTPNVRNLFGTVDRTWLPQGVSVSDHTMIRAGSMVAADGGFLLMHAYDLLSEPGAWQQLVRAMRAQAVDLSPPETPGFMPAPGIKPDVIPVDVKVVLVGDAQTYYMLQGVDPHFASLFKVLADFSDSAPRDKDTVSAYARVIARIVTKEELPHFDRSGIAALAEHGARVGGEKDRLTLRFGRLADIVREAGWITSHNGRDLATRDDVYTAIASGRRRADLPARRFRRMIGNGDIRIDVDGEAIGQINGLAISQTGPLTYGFPARITATIGAGSRGTINIEREANLSGSIHTKGFAILDGLMRHLLRVDHPLAFTASIAFEQSYGGIDGDSASGAECCTLISALTEKPLRQDIAMTGAIDQKGNILPVGGVTEKVEGFFEACRDINFTGTQGVIIPASNAGELMLRPDVVAAARDGKFSVYAVSTIHEALAILTGLPVDNRDNGSYDSDSLLSIAEKRLTHYWQLMTQRPQATAAASDAENDGISPENPLTAGPGKNP